MNKAVAEEERRVRYLARAVDGALAAIAHGRVADARAAGDLIAGLRRLALALFPGSGDTFDLIYRPRLQRALAQRFEKH